MVWQYRRSTSWGLYSAFVAWSGGRSCRLSPSVWAWMPKVQRIQRTEFMLPGGVVTCRILPSGGVGVRIMLEIAKKSQRKARRVARRLDIPGIVGSDGDAMTSLSHYSTRRVKVLSLLDAVGLSRLSGHSVGEEQDDPVTERLVHNMIMTRVVKDDRRHILTGNPLVHRCDCFDTQ